MARIPKLLTEYLSAVGMVWKCLALAAGLVALWLALKAMTGRV